MRAGWMGGISPVPPPFVIASLHKRRVGIDQVFEGKTAVDERLHRLGAVAVRVPLDAGGVVGHLVHHLPAGVGEIEVVLEEIAVAEDMGHDQLLIDEVVAFEQVGVARVVVDHHLVDFGQPVGVALGNLLELHPERPVGVALGEAAVSGDLIDLVVVEDFKDDREEIQPETQGVVLDLVFHLFQFGGKFMGWGVFEHFYLLATEGTENTEEIWIPPGNRVRFAPTFNR